MISSEHGHRGVSERLLFTLVRYRQAGLGAWPGQRIQIADAHSRIVDVCIPQGEPAEQIFTTAPLACIEVLSRRDSLSDLQEVIDDYVSIGVPYCWIINPWKRIVYVGSEHGFDKVAD